MFLRAILLLIGVAAGCTTAAPSTARPVAASPVPDAHWRLQADAAVAEGDFVRARGLYLDALLRTADPCQRAALGRELAVVEARQAKADLPRQTILARHRAGERVVASR